MDESDAGLLKCAGTVTPHMKVQECLSRQCSVIKLYWRHFYSEHSKLDLIVHFMVIVTISVDIIFFFCRAKLASLFGLDQEGSQGNESFQYTAPKQPRKSSNSGQTIRTEGFYITV